MLEVTHHSRIFFSLDWVYMHENYEIYHIFIYFILLYLLLLKGGGGEGSRVPQHWRA